MPSVVETLWGTIESRKANPASGSYTAQLLEAGVPRIVQKIGEEATETLVAALAEPDDRLVSEMADLLYHCLVLLSAKGLTWADIERELERRFRGPIGQ